MNELLSFFCEWEMKSYFLHYIAYDCAEIKFTAQRTVHFHRYYVWTYDAHLHILCCSMEFYIELKGIFGWVVCCHIHKSSIIVRMTNIHIHQAFRRHSEFNSTNETIQRTIFKWNWSHVHVLPRQMWMHSFTSSVEHFHHCLNWSS